MPHHGITSFEGGGRVTELKTRPLPPFTYDFSGCFPLCGEGGFLLCFWVVSFLNNKEMIVNAVAVLIGNYSIYRKKAVLAPGRCAFCGAEKDLEAHHVIGWAEWPQGRIDVSNGLCLCHKCHTEEHRFSPAYHMMLARGG